MHILGGVEVNANTSAQCLASCIGTCQGVDFNSAIYVNIIPITVGVERLVVTPVVAAVDAVVAVVGAWVVGVWVVGAWVVGVGVAAVGAVAEAAGKSTNGVTNKIQ